VGPAPVPVLLVSVSATALSLFVHQILSTIISLFVYLTLVIFLRSSVLVLGKYLNTLLVLNSKLVRTTVPVQGLFKQVPVLKSPNKKNTRFLYCTLEVLGMEFTVILFLAPARNLGTAPVPVPVQRLINKLPVLKSLRKKITRFFYFTFEYSVMEMEVGHVESDVTAAAAAAAHAAAASLATGIAARDTAATAQTTPPETNTNKVKSFSPGNLFIQCSTAKMSEKKININVLSKSDNGPVFAADPVPYPRVGAMFREGENELSNTFHGARIMRGGKTVNEVISCSFDPASMTCISCSNPHSILVKGLPVAICFADQNFLPYFSDNNDVNNSCVAVVRLEDASLGDLVAIASEVLSTHSLNPGSTLLIGSATHLFRSGASGYANDWVKTVSILEQKFKNINVCPLIPVLRDATPGSLARDIEMFSSWLHKVYRDSIKGLLNTWDAVTHFVQHAAVGGAALMYPEIVKTPMPNSITSPGAEINFFQFASSCPAHIQSMDRKVTTELVRILIKCIQSDFSIATGSEVTLPRAAAIASDPQDVRHLICIGSSITKQLIPFLQAQGYKITDLSRPGWLATESNINALIETMTSLQIEPGFGIVFDLFGNCSYRYENFDGTQSLPFKEGGKYHMAGPVTVCSDDIFKRIVRTLAPVLLSAQPAIKVLIPPLPRYVFEPCCSNSTHCTNLLDENYAEKILSGSARLRNVLKKEMAAMGVQRHWVLDGTGALLGVEPGKSAGSARDVLPELRSFLARDGVHLTADGNKNIADTISTVVRNMHAGITMGDTTPAIAVPGTSTLVQRPRDYYWRGFCSPVGDNVGRARMTSGSSGNHCGGGHSQATWGPSRRERGRAHQGHRPYFRRN
jgi:hypothetical protein